MKKSKNIVLIATPVLSAALFNACGSSQPRPLVNTTTPIATPNPVSTVPVQTAQTRDVYNNLNECVKDWLDKELCEQMSEEDDLDYKKRYKTSGKSRYFYGPRYSSSDRIIVYKGKTITPTGKVTTRMPTFTSSATSSKPATTSSSTTSTTKSSTLPSSTSTSKSTTSSTSPSSSTSSSSSTSPYSSSSSSSSSTYSPYSSSSTTRGGFGSTSSSYSSSSSSSRSSSSSGS